MGMMWGSGYVGDLGDVGDVWCGGCGMGMMWGSGYVGDLGDVSDMVSDMGLVSDAAVGDVRCGRCGRCGRCLRRKYFEGVHPSF